MILGRLFEQYSNDACRHTLPGYLKLSDRTKAQKAGSKDPAFCAYFNFTDLMDGLFGNAA